MAVYRECDWCGCTDDEEDFCQSCGNCVDCCECELLNADELFDADELGLDPEEDDQRRYPNA